MDARVNYCQLFESLPDLYLVLSPSLVIEAVSDEYLKSTLTVRNEIVGHELFEIFPDNPNDASADGVINLRSSLQHVINYKQQHVMPVQKYDVRGADGKFEVRYWSPRNTPILNAANQVEFIVHQVKDVTSEHRSAENLRKTERDYSALVNSISDYAIFMLDLSGHVVTWNKAAEFIKGYRADEIIGKSISTFYTSEDVEKDTVRRNLEMAKKHGHYECEGWRVRKDGTLFYANVIFNSLIGEDNQLYGYSKVTRDITDKRKAEEDLRILAGIANNIQDIIITSDNDFRITRWNEAAEKLLGWKSAEVIGKKAESFMHILYPEESKERILQSFKTDGFWKGEVIYHSKAGTPVHVLSTASYMKDAQGNVTSNLILSRDITDRKQAEIQLKEYQHFFNSSYDLCGIANTLGYFEIINGNFSKVLGYSEEEFSNIPFIDLVHPDDIEATLLEYEKLKAGADVIHFVNRYRKRDSSYVDLDWNATPNAQNGKLYCVARDITENKKNQLALNESEQHIQTIFANAPDAILLLDNDGIIVKWNPRAESIFGWTASQIIGKSIYETIIPRSLHVNPVKDLRQFLDIHEERAISKQFELSLLRSDLTSFDAGMSISPTLVNKKTMFIGFVSDITERKKAATALATLNLELEERVKQRTEEIKKREIRFRKLIENSHDVILLLDKGLNVVYRSPSSEKITGWPDQDVMHQSVTKHVHSADIARVTAGVNQQQNVTAAMGNILFRTRHKNGHYLWMEGTVVNSLDDLDVNAIVFSFRDITQQRDLQDLLHKANVLARIGGWEVDLIRNTVYWTDITREIHETAYDYTPDLKTGIDFYKEGPDRQLILDKMSGAFEFGESWDEELQIVTAQNNERWVRVIGETEFAEGKCIRVYGSFQDIDQRKKAQIEVLELNEQLEQKVILRTEELRRSVEDLEAFSYSISHDLRAPLRSILGYTNILNEDYVSQLDAEAKRVTGVIIRNTVKMGQLVDDLLNFAKFSKHDVVKTRVNTEALVKETIETLPSQKDIQWVISSLPDCTGDSNLLRQVWVNLISNAIKYSSKVDQPCIEIGAFTNEQQHTCFFVKDNGVGFNDEYKHKLFKVFHRLHRDSEFEGTGVGLAIVEKVISKHGGQVWAEAQVNKGAQFYFFLPEWHREKR